MSQICTSVFQRKILSQSFPLFPCTLHCLVYVSPFQLCHRGQLTEDSTQIASLNIFSSHTSTSKLPYSTHLKSEQILYVLAGASVTEVMSPAATWTLDPSGWQRWSVVVAQIKAVQSALQENEVEGFRGKGKGKAKA
jgi:hypothetical protein